MAVERPTKQAQQEPEVEGHGPRYGAADERAPDPENADPQSREAEGGDEPEVEGHLKHGAVDERAPDPENADPQSREAKGGDEPEVEGQGWSHG